MSIDRQCAVEGCDRVSSSKRNRVCKQHMKNPDMPPERQIARKGEGSVTKNGYRIKHKVIDGKFVGIFEHREVMEQYLGRPLLPEESVHHRNGVRHDNRLENLELWSKSQPAGQRVKDKLAWAREIVRLYG